MGISDFVCASLVCARQVVELKHELVWWLQGCEGGVGTMRGTRYVRVVVGGGE